MRVKARQIEGDVKRRIFTGVLIEGSGSDFLATLPDSVDGDEVALGAHVEGFVHRFVELSAPLENRKHRRNGEILTDLRMLSAFEVILAALVQKWVSAVTRSAEMPALAEAEARRAAENFILKKLVCLFDASR